MIEDHVDSPSIGDLSNPSGNVVGTVVRRVSGTELDRLGALDFVARCCEDDRTRVAGELDGGGGDAASGGVDQDGLPGCETTPFEQRVVSGEPHARERDGLGPTHRIRDLEHVRRWNQAALGISAGHVRADHAEVTVDVAHPSELGPDPDTRERRIHDHTATEHPDVDLGTDLDYPPRHVHARNVRKGEARQRVPAVPLHDVEVVQRRHRHLDHHVARSRYGIWYLRQLQHLRPAESLILQGLHCTPVPSTLFSTAER